MTRRVDESLNKLKYDKENKESYFYRNIKHIIKGGNLFISNKIHSKDTRFT